MKLGIFAEIEAQGESTLEAWQSLEDYMNNRFTNHKIRLVYAMPSSGYDIAEVIVSSKFQLDV